MDLMIAFESMFLLAFGITALGLGIFTTYFGAGKSRIIGMVLTIIGLVLFISLYVMTTDHWETDDVKNSFYAVIGTLLGMAVSVILIVGLMMVIKEEPETQNMEDLEKELETTEKDEEPTTKESVVETSETEAENEETSSEKPDELRKEEDEEAAEKEKPTAGGGSAGENIEASEHYEGGVVGQSPEQTREDDMSEYLKDREDKKIVKEDWEKVEDRSEKEESPEAQKDEDRETADKEEKPIEEESESENEKDKPEDDEPEKEDKKEEGKKEDEKEEGEQAAEEENDEKKEGNQ